MNCLRGMARGHRFIAMLSAAVVLALAGCTDDPPGAPATNRTSPSASVQPPKPAPPDSPNLRNTAKAMIYNDGIAYVLPETAAQMICGALSPAEWRTVLGGDVGRAVYGDVDAKCKLSTGTLIVDTLRIESLTIEMTRTVQGLGAEGERIAGHRVTVEPSSASGRISAAGAALVPLAEQDIPTQQRVGADPVLHLLARATDLDQPNLPPDLLPGLLRRVLATLLPKLTPDGVPATPVEVGGKLAFTATQPVPGVPIYDLPPTVQSLVLCTVILEVTGIKPPPGAIFVDAVSDCDISRPVRIFAKIDRFLPPVQEQFKIANHPAQEVTDHDIGIVIDLLAMPNEYGNEPRHLALRLQNHASSAQLRAWAEKVATRLLTTS